MKDTTHDILLADAIAAAANQLPFDNRPDSLQRQCTLGLFVAALGDHIALAFPQSAQALYSLVFGPRTTGNPVAPSSQHAEHGT